MLGQDQFMPWASHGCHWDIIDWDIIEMSLVLCYRGDLGQDGFGKKTVRQEIR